MDKTSNACWGYAGGNLHLGGEEFCIEEFGPRNAGDGTVGIWAFDIEQQAVSSGFKREAIPIKNHDLQLLIRGIHVPHPGGLNRGCTWSLPCRRTPAPADGAGESDTTHEGIAAWDRAHTHGEGRRDTAARGRRSIMYYIRKRFQVSHVRPCLMPFCSWLYVRTVRPGLLCGHPCRLR